MKRLLNETGDQDIIQLLIPCKKLEYLGNEEENK